VLDLIEPPNSSPLTNYLDHGGMVEFAGDIGGRSIRVRIFPQPATQRRAA
jgi:hypothetical protein